MPTSTYSYKARDSKGQIVTGSMAGTSAREIGQRLRSEGHFVLEVNDRPSRPQVSLSAEDIRRGEAARRVRREDVVAFCQQLSIMLETGVPVGEALESLHKQSQRREMQMVLGQLKEEVFAGNELSSALARWPRAFPSMMLSLVKASEASGTMALMLGRIGDYLGKERRTARQVRGAMAYPCFMAVVGVVMTVLMVAFVLPRFARIYEQRSATLPGPTRVLIAVSEFCTTQYQIYGPIAVVVMAALAWWLRRPSGRYAADWLRLHVPLLRRMYGQLYLTRAMRTMSTLLAAGVNLLDIIPILRGVTNNRLYDRLWADMEQGVRDGRQISHAAMASPLIPPTVASMIASGERSGRLARVMDRIAQHSEEELDMTVKQVTSYIEPIMIMLMGVVVGGIALALLLPIFSMGKVMTGG